MDIIISKLSLPCDMKWEITQYCYDKNGYTGTDLTNIENEKKKKRNVFMKLRQKLELSLWYKWDWSVSYLRKSLGGGGGVYGKKSVNSVFGGGTSAETKHLQYYNGLTSNCPLIGDDKNIYIEDLVQRGDRERMIRNKLRVIEINLIH